MTPRAGAGPPGRPVSACCSSILLPLPTAHVQASGGRSWQPIGQFHGCVSLQTWAGEGA